MPAVYVYNKSLSQGAMATAVFYAFILILVVLVGSLSAWHWWDAGAHYNRLAYTQAAAKTTTILFAHQTQEASECPPELDCTAETAVQVFTGALYAAYDHSVEIGHAAMRCVAMGALNTPEQGLWQDCNTVFTFTGEGNITAGTILTHGKVFTPEDEVTPMQAVHTVVGGTGAYVAASGGAVSFVPGSTVDYAFTDVLVS